MMNSSENKITGWKLFFLAEFMAFVIGLVMPITPSKTGSDVSIANIFFTDPNYFEEFIVYFILANILLCLIAAGFYIWSKWKNL